MHNELRCKCDKYKVCVLLLEVVMMVYRFGSFSFSRDGSIKFCQFSHNTFRTHTYKCVSVCACVCMHIYIYTFFGLDERTYGEVVTKST